MILKKLHEDLERYLAEDCYCPGEIYDISGFFFKVYNGDEECIEINRGVDYRDPNKMVLTVECGDQIINFWVKDNRIIDAERYDATENNIRIMPLIIAGTLPSGEGLNEFRPGETKKNLNEIFSIADAIIN